MKAGVWVPALLAVCVVLPARAQDAREILQRTAATYDAVEQYYLEGTLSVEMEAGGETDLDDPHEGEEFGYVLSGSVQIDLGERTVRARKGESFCFRSTEPHRLSNPGKTVCRLLWVSTPPSF